MRIRQNIDGFFWRGLKWANAALLLLLFALAACWYCLYAGKTVPVPDLLIDAVERELAANGVVVECGAMRLGADFSIVAEDIVLREHDKGREFFTAKRVCAGLSPRLLFGGKIPVRYLSVFGGSVLGEGGAPILGDIYLGARFGRSSHSLDFFRARFFNAEIVARGKVENKCSLADLERVLEVASKKFAAKESGESGGAARGAGLLERINEAAAAGKWLEKFSSPSVEIDFGLLSGGSNFINVGVFAGAAKYDGGKFSLSAEGLKASLSYANTNTRERIFITASAEAVDCGSHKASARGLSFRSGVNVNESDIALFDVDFSASEAVFDGTSAGRVSLGNKMISPDSFCDGWSFFVLRGGDRLRGNFDFSLDGCFSCEFSGKVDPCVILRRKEFAGIPEMEDFDFPSGVYLNGSAKYSAGGAPPSAEVFVEASNCKIMRLDIDCATAFAEFDGAILRCRDIIAKTAEGWGARGSYTQDFNTNAYEIEVKGSIRPMAISHFMEPWWGKIMGSFSFGKNVPMPRADIRVEGVWGAPERIWCFGFVEGVEAVYNGSKFDSFSMFVWVNPSRITLYDIEMAAGRGARKGHCFIEWLYGAGGLTAYGRQRLFLRSGLSPSELISLGGADAQEVFDIVKFANPPQISLNALMFNPANNPAGRRDLFNAEIRGNGDVSVEMITFQNPHFFSRSDKIDTDILGATFVFCGGDASGDAHIKRVADTAIVDGMVSAHKMNQGLFFDFLESLGGSEESGGGESPLGGGGSGEVSAGLKLRGDVKNMANSNGGGYIEINSKDFLKLNIFGGISKAFASIGVPMGSFDITKVKTDFDIGGGELKLSPVEFEGPTMRIIGAAAYGFKDGRLRGGLKAYPFDKMENRVVAMVNKIVNPIMDAVRVKVSGTLSNPGFSAKITPADIITDEKTLIEKIDESL